MLRNVQTAIAHIGPVICRGEWHMGTDATLATFIDDLPGNFFPITNADLHAKVALPAPLPHKAEMMLVNRSTWRSIIRRNLRRRHARGPRSSGSLLRTPRSSGRNTLLRHDQRHGARADGFCFDPGGHPGPLED